MYGKSMKGKKGMAAGMKSKMSKGKKQPVKGMTKPKRGR
jgi:hypothetical protein